MEDYARHTAEGPEGLKARKLYLLLRQEILDGAYPVGDRLPSEARLSEAFGVSRVTVRRALESLASEGFIEKRVGAGSIVRSTTSAPPIRADMASLIPQLVTMETRSTARLLSFGYGPASAQVARALDLAEGTPVQKAVRVRLSDDQVFSHLTTHVPEDIATAYDEADLAAQPLFRLLERGGVRVAAAEQTVTAALAGPDVAEALGVSVGAALLSLTRIVRDEAGRGVEHLAALYRPDLFRLEMKLNRVGEGPGRHWEPVIAGLAEGRA